MLTLTFRFPASVREGLNREHGAKMGSCSIPRLEQHIRDLVNAELARLMAVPEAPRKRLLLRRKVAR